MTKQTTDCLHLNPHNRVLATQVRGYQLTVFYIKTPFTVNALVKALVLIYAVS